MGDGMMNKNVRIVVVAAICVLSGPLLPGFAAGSLPTLHGLTAEAGSSGPVIHLRTDHALETVHYSPQPGVWIVEMPEASWETGTATLSEPSLGIERAELSLVDEFGKRVTRLTVWLDGPSQLQLANVSDGMDLVFSSFGDTSDADEIQAKLSPDERWVAYASDLSGRLEVYVQPFPNLGATIRVSPNGGQEPLWSPSGDRLYYRSITGRRVFAVDVLDEEPLRFGREELLFEGDFTTGIRWGRKWDIHPDGDRFLMLRVDYPAAPEGIRVVANWFGELERLVPSND